MKRTKIDIRRAMTEHNISYATLSERTGIDKGNINKLFNGNPTLNKLIAVADAIGIDITDLFYPIDEEITTVDNSAKAEVNNSEINAETTISGEKKGYMQQTIQTIAFCPHCGTKVHVGVVLMPE